MRKDGTCFGASVVIDPIRDDDGQLIGCTKLTWDITGRKHTEEALEVSEECFRMLVEGVTDYAVYLKHADKFLFGIAIFQIAFAARKTLASIC